MRAIGAILKDPEALIHEFLENNASEDPFLAKLLSIFQKVES